MTEEIWKDIPGYEGLYQASTLGNIRSLPKSDIRHTKRATSVWNVSGKILKGRVGRHGYLIVAIYKNQTRCDISIHRLICLTFLDNPEQKPYVNHKNCIKYDNRLENLEWCTQKENIAHAWANGKMKTCKGKFLGTKSVHSKLTEDQVVEMRTLYASGGYTHKYFADKYNMSRRHIGDIINKICWPHV